jgi:nucleotide-binding universal stress UspA family protein
MDLPSVDVKKVLYATDLSENARLAFAYAVSVANRYDAGLTILHVVSEDPDMDAMVSGYISGDQWKQIKQEHLQEARQALIGKQREGHAIREVLDRFTEEAQTDLAFRTDEILVERGKPAEKILQVARERSMDLIVMGTYGFGTLKDAVMGGTSRRVLRRAGVPVLLVRIPED